MTHPTLGHHMPSQTPSQTTGTTSDQHQPISTPGARPTPLGPDQTGGERLTPTHHHLRLTRDNERRVRALFEVGADEYAFTSTFSSPVESDADGEVTQWGTCVLPGGEAVAS